MNLHLPNSALWLLFPLGFVALWLLVSFVIAQVGWNRLRDFATHSPPQGEQFWLQSATIGGAQYRGALVFTVAPNGLYLRPLWLFGFFHRPLFIPYGAFGAYKSQKVMWLSSTEFTVHNAYGQKVLMTLDSKWLSDAVILKIQEQRDLQGGGLRASAPLR